MSSPSSRPIEMRTRPGVMPIAAWSSGVRLTWVLVRRVAHQRLRAAERRGRAGDAQGVEHRPGGVDAAGEVDGEHRRQARQLALGQLVLGVVGQAGVVHGGDAGVPAQRLGHAQGHVGLVALAHGERADAAQPVEGVVRRGAGAVQHGVGPDGVEQVALAGDHAERGVVVPADALRRRVQHEVDAVAQRLLADRRGERRVDHRERPADGAELVEVDEVEARVGRRLGDDEHRAARPHGGGEGAGRGAVDDGVLDAEAGARALHEGRSCRRRSGAG